MDSPPKAPSSSPPKAKRERVVRDDILSVLREIRVEPGQALRQVEPAQIIYERAKEFAKWAPNATKTGELYRFKMNFVYGLLIEDAWRSPGRGVSLDGIQSHGVIEGWQNACKALLRYALNLHLAPKRPEFRRMKLSSSFYVYQVSKKLQQAERILVAMGYKQVNTSREVQELQYEGDVKTLQVLETAADLVILHSELELVKELVNQVLEGSHRNPQFMRITLEDILRLRAENDLKYHDVWPTLVRQVSSPYNQPRHDQQFEDQQLHNHQLGRHLSAEPRTEDHLLGRHLSAEPRTEDHLLGRHLSAEPRTEDYLLGRHLSAEPRTEGHLSFQEMPHLIDRAGVLEHRRESAPVVGTVPLVLRDYHTSPRMPLRREGHPPQVPSHPQTQQAVWESNQQHVPPSNQQQEHHNSPYNVEQIHDMLHGKAEHHNECPTDPPITSSICSPVSHPPLYDNLPLDPAALLDPQDIVEELKTLTPQHLPPPPRDDLRRQSVPELGRSQQPQPQPQHVIYTHGSQIKISTTQFHQQLTDLYQQFPDLAADQYANIPGEGDPEATLVPGRTYSIGPDPTQLPEPVVSTREDLAKMDALLQSTRIMSINPEIKDVHSVHDDGYVGPHLESLRSPPQSQPMFSDTENIDDKWKVHSPPPVPTSPRQPHSSSKDRTSPAISLGSEGTTETREVPSQQPSALDNSKTLETHLETDDTRLPHGDKPRVATDFSEPTIVPSAQKPKPIPRKKLSKPDSHSFDVPESDIPHVSSHTMSKSQSDTRLPPSTEPMPATGPTAKFVPVPVPRKSLSPSLSRKETAGKDVLVPNSGMDTAANAVGRDRPSNIPGNFIKSRGLLAKSSAVVGPSNASASSTSSRVGSSSLPRSPVRVGLKSSVQHESSLDHGGEILPQKLHEMENDSTLMEQGNGTLLKKEYQTPDFESRHWECKFCTNLFNDLHSNVCEICQHSRS